MNERRLIALSEEQAKRLRTFSRSTHIFPSDVCRIARSLADAYESGITEEEGQRIIWRANLSDSLGDKFRTLFTPESKEGPR